MEGVPLIPPPPSRPSDGPEHICEECGRAFRARLLEDVVCDTCYEAQFEPGRLRRWQRSNRQHSSR
jgi:hypothetical protein